MSNLYSYVKVDRPAPKCLATSQEIRDRGSAFVGSVYHASTPEEAKAAIFHHRNIVHAGKKAYEISAWRCMMLKHGKQGSGVLMTSRLKRDMTTMGNNGLGAKCRRSCRIRVYLTPLSSLVDDIYSSFTRRFGGTLLGPTRFVHIDTCATEVCRTFKRVEEMEECISTLIRLDNMLASLRQELNNLTQNAELATSGSTSTRNASDETNNVEGRRNRQPDYTAVQRDLDITKARRLVGARENAVKSVKSLLSKKRTMLAIVEVEA
ncbi:hypothetical protein EDB19DRAFT_360306 [Suillus lakei]|nr:hypothetical protein EDB19DRAFT_360306 [Suillus lakei]